jgi:hypothetical protein
LFWVTNKVYILKSSFESQSQPWFKLKLEKGFEFKSFKQKEKRKTGKTLNLSTLVLLSSLALSFSFPAAHLRTPSGRA